MAEEPAKVLPIPKTTKQAKFPGETTQHTIMEFIAIHVKYMMLFSITNANRELELRRVSAFPAEHSMHAYTNYTSRSQAKHDSSY